MKSIRECTARLKADLPTLVWTRGRDFPIARLEGRMKCPRCGPTLACTGARSGQLPCCLGFSVEQMISLLAPWQDRSRASSEVKRSALDHLGVLPVLLMVPPTTSGPDTVARRSLTAGYRLF
jgi:hypothetical protein